MSVKFNTNILSATTRLQLQARADSIHSQKPFHFQDILSQHSNMNMLCLFNLENTYHKKNTVFLFLHTNGKKVKTMAFNFNKLALESKFDLS